jgi:hypothetical protein
MVALKAAAKGCGRTTGDAVDSLVAVDRDMLGAALRMSAAGNCRRGT